MERSDPWRMFTWVEILTHHSNVGIRIFRNLYEGKCLSREGAGYECKRGSVHFYRE